MQNIKLRFVEKTDIPSWLGLTKEYDKYTEELVVDLSEWYGGNENEMPFTDYMNSKIERKLAVMAVSDDISLDNKCLGIIAFSRTNNRITFFAVSHKADYNEVSSLLIDYVLDELNTNEPIYVNVLKSNAEMICKERNIFYKYGFVFKNEEKECGVPVDRLCRK